MSRIWTLTAGIGLVFALAAVAVAQSPTQAAVAWADPASPCTSYVEAEAQKKNIPVEFTIKKQAAALLVFVQGDEQEGSTARAIFTGNSGRKSTLTTTVVSQQSGIVVFSYTCHQDGHAPGP